MTPQHFAGWMPFRIAWNDGNAVVDWFRLGDIQFDDAYFSDTVKRCADRPFNLIFRRETPLETLEAVASRFPVPAPSGLIFHLSRSGSTLVTRTLATLPSVLALSEATPIEDVLKARSRNPKMSDDETVHWLRCVVAVLSRPQRSDQRHCIVKLDSWHAAELAIFERAFPGVPRIFLYRDPLEVLVSHLHRSSYMMSAANGPRALGVPVTEAIRIPQSEYCARVLARIQDAVLARAASSEELVNHAELPDAIWDRIAARFELPLPPHAIAAMQASAQYNPRLPGQRHVDDRAAKQSAADDDLRKLASQWLVPGFRRLEERRRSKPSVVAPSA